MTVSRVERGGLRIAQELDDLVKNAIAPGTGIAVEAFWSGFETCLDELGPLNRELLSVRDEFQRQIDQWHLDRKGSALDAQEYKTFLSDIGYLLPEPDDFEISTANVDEEISTLAGPQLVVPVMNA